MAKSKPLKTDLIWHTEKRKLKDLVPFEKNPRKLPEAVEKALRESLYKFNLVEIPAINTDNKIIAGHQRVKIMTMLTNNPEMEIELRVPNRALTEKEFEEYNIRSNKNHGEFDNEILFKEFDLPDLINYGFTELQTYTPELNPAIDTGQITNEE